MEQDLMSGLPGASASNTKNGPELSGYSVGPRGLQRDKMTQNKLQFGPRRLAAPKPFRRRRVKVGQTESNRLLIGKIPGRFMQIP
jgi:hypothetical protein